MTLLEALPFGAPILTGIGALGVWIGHLATRRKTLAEAQEVAQRATAGGIKTLSELLDDLGGEVSRLRAELIAERSSNDRLRDEVSALRQRIELLTAALLASSLEVPQDTHGGPS